VFVLAGDYGDDWDVRLNMAIAGLGGAGLIVWHVLAFWKTASRPFTASGIVARAREHSRRWSSPISSEPG
jgi:hypothetical protein